MLECLDEYIGQAAKWFWFWYVLGIGLLVSSVLMIPFACF
jgi:hypothetical protein